MARVNDQPRGEAEHLAGEVEVLGPVLPEGRNPLVQDGVAEEPADDSPSRSIASRYAVAVAAADREPRDRWWRTKSWRTTTPGVRRSASTIQPCASGLLPMW